MEEILHLSRNELEAGLGHILGSPRDAGTLETIVRRPRVNEREVVAQAMLDLNLGLVGDSWETRGASPDIGRQLTLMNARVIALLAQSKDLWALAGDQLFVDLDLSAANLPPGTRLRLGDAVIEVTALPHNGCEKFKARFGRDALEFVNGPAHRELRLRGINARVVTPGLISVGEKILKI